MSTNTKSIAFLGATGGCGLSALRHALAAGHTCIALCRTPSKLTDRFPPAEYPHLTVVQGNAHDVAAVKRCLVDPRHPDQPRLVDSVVFSIGGTFIPSRLTIDDPHVCERGMETLLQALADIRRTTVSQGGDHDDDDAPTPKSGPVIVAVSTTGISKAGRDLPLVMWALYRGMLGVPHADKEAMENKLVAADEDFVVVRPSLLVDGGGGGDGEAQAPAKEVKVGIEDLKHGRHVVEKQAWGYTISREDVGRWMYENLLRGDQGGEYIGKAVSLTW
ncbi:hypothetical protein PFICI_12694 [Pestalotiopsis fici W106-1]|uniref:NAD(P)-binding domain-containing protein n=1 Tax=Pestalotiopsis fici (strain W106-1 / CGMCC3.15140) TaxID=1229662 RepID=W3WPE1_PESFW|nr:uncharacterized protein PFICI_12694 [Pestalotiopsis fici W106-1]ETS75750.1 hypothetical protein PFICI_12694 [Pestalotiopsis fici W106-1]